MIVRILGDRTYEVPDKDLEGIQALDERLDKALNGGDEAGFTSALAQLIEKVRSACAPLPDDDDRPSDLVLPHDGATLQEVRDMLDAEV